VEAARLAALVWRQYKSMNVVALDMSISNLIYLTSCIMYSFCFKQIYQVNVFQDMFLLSHPNRTEHVFQHPVCCCPLGIESIDNEASYSFMGSNSFDPWQGVSVEEPTPPEDGSGNLGANISQLNCGGSRDAKRCQEISGFFMSGGRGCQTSRSPPCRPGREWS